MQLWRMHLMATLRSAIELKRQRRENFPYLIHQYFRLLPVSDDFYLFSVKNASTSILNGAAVRALPHLCRDLCRDCFGYLQPS